MSKQKPTLPAFDDPILKNSHMEGFLEKQAHSGAVTTSASASSSTTTTSSTGSNNVIAGTGGKFQKRWFTMLNGWLAYSHKPPPHAKLSAKKAINLRRMTRGAFLSSLRIVNIQLAIGEGPITEDADASSNINQQYHNSLSRVVRLRAASPELARKWIKALNARRQRLNRKSVDEIVREAEVVHMMAQKVKRMQSTPAKGSGPRHKKGHKKGLIGKSHSVPASSSSYRGEVSSTRKHLSLKEKLAAVEARMDMKLKEKGLDPLPKKKKFGKRTGTTPSHSTGHVSITTDTRTKTKTKSSSTSANRKSSREKSSSSRDNPFGDDDDEQIVTAEVAKSTTTSTSTSSYDYSNRRNSDLDPAVLEAYDIAMAQRNNSSNSNNSEPNPFADDSDEALVVVAENGFTGGDIEELPVANRLSDTVSSTDNEVDFFEPVTPAEPLGRSPSMVGVRPPSASNPFADDEDDSTAAANPFADEDDVVTTSSTTTTTSTSGTAHIKKSKSTNPFEDDEEEDEEAVVVTSSAKPSSSTSNPFGDDDDDDEDEEAHRNPFGHSDNPFGSDTDDDDNINPGNPFGDDSPVPQTKAKARPKSLRIRKKARALAVMSGFMVKYPVGHGKHKVGMGRKRKRFFVLSGNSLKYYDDRCNSAGLGMDGEPARMRGMAILSDEAMPEGHACGVVKKGPRGIMATGFALGEVAYLKLEAPSERERDMWVDALMQTIEAGREE